MGSAGFLLVAGSASLALGSDTASVVTNADFVWQTGCAEFSVSPMHVELVREYIRNQPEHHKQAVFQTDFRRFCEKNGKALDERYAWD